LLKILCRASRTEMSIDRVLCAIHMKFQIDSTASFF
jgi:hypothetical protein